MAKSNKTNQSAEKGTSKGPGNVITMIADNNAKESKMKVMIPVEFLNRISALETLIKHGYPTAINKFPDHSSILEEMRNDSHNQVKKEINTVKALLYYYDLLPAFELFKIDPAKTASRYPGDHYQIFFESNRHLKASDVKIYFETEIGKSDLYDFSDFINEEQAEFIEWKNRVNRKIIELSSEVNAATYELSKSSLLGKARKWKLYYTTDRDHSVEKYEFAHHLNDEKLEILDKAISTLAQIENILQPENQKSFTPAKEPFINHKTIIIKPEAQKALMNIFNNSLESDLEKDLFAKAISGEKIDRKVLFKSVIAKDVITAFSVLLEKEFIIGIKDQGLGKWIIDTLSFGTTKDSTIRQYVKTKNIPGNKKSFFSPIANLINSK